MSTPPRSNSNRLQPHYVLAGVLLTVIVVVGLLVLALRVAYAGEALPGTQVASVSLGGASAAESRKRLAPVAGTDVPITVRAAGKTYRLKPSMLGYEVDLDRTVENALEAGRDGPLGGVIATVTGVVRSREVPLVTRVDQERFDRTVASLVNEIDRPPFPGEIRVRTEPIRVERLAPRTGRTADPDEVGRLLERAIRRRARDTVRIPVESEAVASREDVEEVARAAEDYLTRPLRLTGAGKPLEVSPEQLAGVLALESLDGGRRVRLGAGDKRVDGLVNQIAPARDRAPRNAKISASNPGASLSDKGDVSWRPRSAKVKVSGGRPGREVRREDAARAIEAAIREGSHSTKLPVKRTGATVSRDDADEVDQLIGTFTTLYEPGQPRVTNIRKMAATIDGTVIAPGAQFSLNGIVGERTEAKGYLPAPFIAEGNKLEDSVGGGVSQFSTTMYNAAYFAGLQIDAHTPHSFYISRYPAGREATLNFGSIDLLWTNDTKTPIFVKTVSDATSVTVSLYGNNGGRKVGASSAPRQSRPGGGFSVVVTRSVRSDGKTKKDSYTTTYGVPAESE
ncbi:MAG: VanW family protein [Solirubrobacterales bacterium]|nr:VanW family protein [Solirubrobacterales bacterium]